MIGENSEQAFDISGTIEEYWKLALFRLSRRRRQITKQCDPNAESTWRMLAMCDQLERLAERQLQKASE